MLKDGQIVQSLTEKLQLFADLAESVAGLEDASSRSRLLLRGDTSDLQQGEQLLKGAITEGNMSGWGPDESVSFCVNCLKHWRHDVILHLVAI